MDLALDRPEGYLFVRRVGPRSVVLVDRELATSFLLAPDQAVENWSVSDAGVLDASHVDALLALQPELVSLGTGERQRFPAAARTYNLLAGEGRHVVAGFILPLA